MKSKSQTSQPTLSSQSLKTLISLAVLAYVVQIASSAPSLLSTIVDPSYPFNAFMIYPLTTMLLPALSFVLAYSLCGSAYTKLWRAGQAVLIAFMSVIMEGFLAAISQALFSPPLGNEYVSPNDDKALLQLIPTVISLGVVVAISVWLRRQQTPERSDASHVFQKGFSILLPVLVVGQTIAIYIWILSGSSDGQIRAADLQMGVFFGIVTPAIVWAILFLLASRKKTVMQRIFTALVYLVMGVFLFIVCMFVPYLLFPMIAGSVNASRYNLLLTSTTVLALLFFISLVAWHKKKRLY